MPYPENSSEDIELDILDFDRWVNDNNPDPKLSYGKGWWDFVEIIRRLAWRLDLKDISTAATFALHTPPPPEVLNSPVVRILTPQYCVYLKEDFGQFSAPWTLSVERYTQGTIANLALFLADELPDQRSLQGFESDWVFPPFSESETRFTARVEDELDVYAILRLLTSAAAKPPVASPGSTS